MTEMYNPPATAERAVLYQRIMEAADAIAHRISRDALAVVYLHLLRQHLPFLSTLTLYHYVETLEEPKEELERIVTLPAFHRFPHKVCKKEADSPAHKEYYHG